LQTGKAVIASARRQGSFSGSRHGRAVRQTKLMEVADGLSRLTRYGRGWRVQLGPRTTMVDHRVGMYHLAVLIANPGAEIAAADLVAGLGAVTRRAANHAMPRQAVLDMTAVRQYRQRLAQLEDSPDDAGSGERDWLRAELSANTAPGGRTRAFSDSSERARLAVGRAIWRAVANIERADPEIGAHLRQTVYTGIRCWYRPF
jgi:hypothetical protein